MARAVIVTIGVSVVTMGVSMVVGSVCSIAKVGTSVACTSEMIPDIGP